MKYLDAFNKENLRLYPPFMGDYILNDLNVVFINKFHIYNL
jgi:hypothetical protein